MTEHSPVQTPTNHTFQVDLRGVVDLLSHHLYSSPSVYLRELMQNGVDAITARRQHDAQAAGQVRLVATGGTLRVDDTGIGLSEADLHRLLATIGRSSKRDSLEAARTEFLGRFGIGLLACFLVTDEIRVVSRSAVHPGEPVVEWLARSDGSYTVRTLPDSERTEPGTTVYLAPRRGSEPWFAPERVVELARHHGSLLRVDVVVETGDGAPAQISGEAVWDASHPSPASRQAALNAYCDELFGFVPLDAIELRVPVAGVRGVAYVLPTSVSPAQRSRHRVHLKGMLLTDAADGLLPDWAFFVRCVLDTDSLRPTASRENLYDDDTLAAVREALGDQLRGWLATLAASDPERLRRFLAVHSLGVKALARHDVEMFRIMLPWLPFETSAGPATLDEVARAHPVVHLASTVEEFRQVAPVAAAHGLAVVNGGYTYDADLVRLLPEVRPGAVVSDLGADVVTAYLDMVDPQEELALGGFLAVARGRLDPLSCDPVLRAFQPVSVPALYLDDRAARNERNRVETAAEADDLWAGILGSLRGSAPRAQLVLNHLNPLVRRIAALPNHELAGTAVESLYGQALLMSQRPLRSADSALLNRAFLNLLEWATHTERGHE